jgi:3-hydroxymyristoyl/3-hydroxydecanoyl-(acyl carrier protein) dehydratase
VASLHKPDNRLEFFEIAALLPFKQPWLLIDRIVSWEANKEIVAEKCISGADPLVAAHYPLGPSIIPGVLLIELVGQASLLLTLLSKKHALIQTSVLARCKANFVSPAWVGETLTARVLLVDEIQGKVLHEGIILAGDRKICNVELLGATGEITPPKR